jgi:hypothetical protein
MESIHAAFHELKQADSIAKQIQTVVERNHLAYDF